MQYLFIHIEVQDGERRHDHKVLHTTNCKNLQFAVEWYTSHYWGYGTRDFDNEWWWWGDFCGRVKSWNEITKKEFNILNKYL